ncbi:MAG: hypothetical protein KatS3mg121_1430 [Gammaproteobacteria bacterium]|nr:MAG: hypothetical protein KatS3mg121_1430 [Gammaproteobacteria bacterium]
MPDALIQEGGIEMSTGAAGLTVFFDRNVLHGSCGNIAPFSRNNVFIVYNSIENTLREPYCGRPPRPAFLAERRPRPLTPSGESLAAACLRGGV